MSFNRINKFWQYLHKGILCSSRDEKITATCKNMDESQEHNVGQKNRVAKWIYGIDPLLSVKLNDFPMQ